jgi:hypothetical protein
MRASAAPVSFANADADADADTGTGTGTDARRCCKVRPELLRRLRAPVPAGR